MTESPRRPWEKIEDLADRSVDLGAYVDSLTPSEVARALAHLGHDDQNRLLEALSAEDAAEILDRLPLAQAADLVEQLSPEVAASIVTELPSDGQADLVTEMHGAEAEALLDALDPDVARDIMELAHYSSDVAGGLMVREFIAVSHSWNVGQVVGEFRRQVGGSGLDVQYVYVVHSDGVLAGVLPIRDLLISDPGTPIDAIMIHDPIAVDVEASLEALTDVFDRWDRVGLPVVGGGGQLLGIVRQSDLRDAIGERAEADHLKSAGIVGGDELRSMPLVERSRRRLSWLSINVVLNIAAASVIAMFEETLAAVIALAFFLPIISDMSGCSGNQSVAVSVRELSLGLVKPREVSYVWLKEIGIGVINGAVLGSLLGLVAWLWQGNGYLGVVVGLALAANTMIAVSIGGAVPLILKRFNMDPALASGPILTTVTDICGFALVLGIATAMLPLLIG